MANTSRQHNLKQRFNEYSLRDNNTLSSNHALSESLTTVAVTLSKREDSPRKSNGNLTLKEAEKRIREQVDSKVQGDQK